ncbi:flavodoxin domain-containing protein [Frateuria sp. GZRR35]|uniref:flavodoxin domain-containing protein n=1 Tax=Frateuria sp. GZRR35 TaxID=3351536 RepID=UPI003EDBB8E6
MSWISRIGLRIAAGTAVASPSWGAAMRPTVEPLCEPSLLLAYATQTGVAEHHARDTAARLRRAGMIVRLMEFDALTPELLAASPHALLVVSTTYDGDPPDMAQAFCECMGAPAALDGLHYGLLSLGDRCYREFCGFGRRLHAWLQISGAHAGFPPVEVDDEDAAALADWHRQVDAWLVGGAFGLAHTEKVPL